MKIASVVILASSILFLSGCATLPSDISKKDFYVRQTGGTIELLAMHDMTSFILTMKVPIDGSTIVFSDNILVIPEYKEMKVRFYCASLSKIVKGDIVLHMNSDPSEELILHSVSYNLENTRPAVMNEASTADPILVGDFDGDGAVRLEDFDEFAESFGSIEGNPKYREIFDISSENQSEGYPTKYFTGVWERFFSVLGSPDGKISIDDFDFFAKNFGSVHPYLGEWVFNGSIDYDSGTYGNVSAVGSGMLDIVQKDWQMSGPVKLTANSTYVDENGAEVEETFTIEIDSVNVEFSTCEMIINGTVVNPINAVEYSVLMKGKLRAEGNAIFAESNGTGDGYGIFLLYPTRKIGEWTASK